LNRLLTRIGIDVDGEDAESRPACEQAGGDRRGCPPTWRSHRPRTVVHDCGQADAYSF
jgi:hypothetical protein